ncbi:Shedu anti-phage system protein SduA domain-containing protein [Streptomyces sp. NPDC007896]|uniref:Shedu anti-phage system protein SduA domain-containing protein n=1 Tax=Streptomyces sp. NPDC007896 TaxID=3364784 RepID=UPI0036F06B4E
MTPEEKIEQLSATLRGVNHPAPVISHVKYRKTVELLASAIGQPPNAFYPSRVSAPSNVSVRLAQSKTALGNAFLIAVILDGELSPQLSSAAKRFFLSDGRPLILLQQKISNGVERWSIGAAFVAKGDRKSIDSLKLLADFFTTFHLTELEVSESLTLPSSALPAKVVSMLSAMDEAGISPTEFAQAVIERGEVDDLMAALTGTRVGLSAAEIAVLSKRREEVAELKRLALTPRTTETTLQAAISNKYWLFGGKYVRVLPRRRFTLLDEFDIPLLCADGSVHIVELKGPFIESLVTDQRKHFIVGNEVHRAVSQTINYLRTIDDQRAVVQTELREEINLDIDLRRIHATVVIGHPHHLNDRGITRSQIDQAFRAYNSHLSRVNVMTYADLLDSAERSLTFEVEAWLQASDRV